MPDLAHAGRSSIVVAMRLAWIVVCVMAGSAHADDSRAVDAAIRSVLDGSQPWMVPDGKTGWYERLAGVKLAGPSGAPIASRDELERELADCGLIAGITWHLGAPVVGVDGRRRFAWFQAPVAST
jgi:hypothetical protein